MFYQMVKKELSHPRSFCSKNIRKYNIEDLEKTVRMIDAGGGSEDWMYEEMTVIARIRDNFPDFTGVNNEITEKTFRYTAIEAEKLLATLIATCKHGYFEFSVYKKFLQCVIYLWYTATQGVDADADAGADASMMGVSDDRVSDDEFDVCDKLSNLNVNERL